MEVCPGGPSSESILELQPEGSEGSGGETWCMLKISKDAIRCHKGGSETVEYRDSRYQQDGSKFNGSK